MIDSSVLMNALCFQGERYISTSWAVFCGEWTVNTNIQGKETGLEKDVSVSNWWYVHKITVILKFLN